MNFQLQRHAGNPILSPLAGSTWEDLVTTNPAAWFESERGEVVMLYRAAGHDAEHRVRFGLARSRDGFRFERASDRPVFAPSIDGFDAGCVEDPRLTKMGKTYFITYAARPHPPGRYWENPEDRSYTPPRVPPEYPALQRENLTATGLALTEDFQTFVRAGVLSDPSVDDRDVILFPEKIGGRFVSLHRPLSWCGTAYGTAFPGIWIGYSDDVLQPKKLQLLAKARFPWERKIGGSTPPLRTAAGWLTLYHAVGPDRQYRIGAMLLDLEQPHLVRHRSPQWLYQPEEPWECRGLYNGVVFPCGNVVIDGILHVYYGGGDVHCGVCTCALDQLVDYLVGCPVETT